MTASASLPEHLCRAAAWQEDVTVEHIADVYAQGILAAADAEGQAQTVLEEFDSLVEDLLDRLPEWEAVLCSPRISPEEKIGVLQRVFQGRCSVVFLESLKTLARRGRLDCLRPIRQRLHVHWERRKHQVRVLIRSAAALSPSELDQIRQVLRTKLADEPILQTEVDPQLIGGLVLRIGDVIYDGSLANQLEHLRQRILQRSEQKFMGTGTPPSPTKAP